MCQYSSLYLSFMKLELLKKISLNRLFDQVSIILIPKNHNISVTCTKNITVDIQHTLDADPMLVYCWPAVCDVGPALSQHWVSVSFSLDIPVNFALCLPCQQTRDIDSILYQCLSIVYNAGPTLVENCVDVSCCWVGIRSAVPGDAAYGWEPDQTWIGHQQWVWNQ